MVGACTFEAVVPDAIWVTERPVWFSGIRQRARTTVVRLSSGALWVHSACKPTDEVCEALDALGRVQFIVVPNRYHHLEAAAMAARYPDAMVVGPKSAEARNQSLRLTGGLDDPEYIEATPELSPHQLNGVPFLDETVFFHHESKTLVAADLLMSACSRDHWTSRLVGRALGHYERVRTPPDVRWNTKPQRAIAESIEQIRSLPMKRILVAHSDPIAERPAEWLAQAWEFATPPEAKQSITAS